jgi:high affinity Mn2+ porin
LSWRRAIAASTSAQAEDPGSAQLKQLEARIEALEQRNATLESALEDDHLREDAPDIVTRLKAVEFQALGMQRQARMVEALEGITAGISLTHVAQRTSSVTPDESQLNFRADAFVTLPGGSIGSADASIFAQFRLGQGDGLASLPPSFSAPNTSAFRVAGTNPDDSAALLAQAWYQIDVPLPLGGYKPRSKQKLTINFGKIDPFLFFDQNNVADDETARFLNTVFVHNPMLDAGGDIGADAYGFTPGIRVAYANESNKGLPWGVSAGVFGADTGAHYTDSLSRPTMLLQAEVSPLLALGLRGNYRIYVWQNGRATPFANEFDLQRETHRGVGISVDQRVHDAVTVFARLGSSSKGQQRFERATTIGVDIGGNYWGRAADGLGIAIAHLPASPDFRAVSATLDADADAVPDFGWQAQGAEKVAEIYYRMRLNSQFEISPDVQWVQHSGADQTRQALVTAGVRLQLTF